MVDDLNSRRSRRVLALSVLAVPLVVGLLPLLAMTPAHPAGAAGTREGAGAIASVRQDGAAGQLGRARPGLSSHSTAVAFSHDDRLLAVAEQSGRLWLWDPHNDRPLAELPWASATAVQHLGFTADGRLVAGGGDRMLVFDVQKRRPVHTISLPSNILAMALCPGDRKVAVSIHHHVVLYDLQGEKEPRQLEGIDARPGALAFSPDGTMLASASNRRRVQLSAVENGGQVGDPIQLDFLPRALVYSPDGEDLIVGGHESSLIVFDAHTREERHRHGEGINRQLFELAISADGSTLIGREGGRVTMWRRDGDYAHTTLTSHLRVYSVRGTTIAASSDGSIIAAARRTSAAGFDLYRAEDGRRPGSRDGHIGIIRAMAACDEGRTLVSWGEDQQVIIWDLEQRHPRHAVEAAWEAYYAHLAVVGGQVWTASFITSIGHVTAIDLDTAQPAPLDVPTGELRGAAIIPDGDTAVAVGWGGGLEVRSLDDWEAQLELPDLPSSPGAMAFAPHGRRAAMLEAGAVSIWETDTWQMVRRFSLEAGRESAAALALAGDDRLAAVARSDGTVRILELPGGGVVTAIGGEDGAVRPRPIAFLPGRIGVFYTVDDSGVLMQHDLVAAETVPISPIEGPSVTSLLVIEPAGVLAAGTSEGTILLYPLAEPAARPRLKLDDDALAAIWESLAAADAGRGYRAAHHLARGGDAAARWLAERISPASVDEAAIGRHVMALDDSRYEHREHATGSLIRLGRAARPHLQRWLEEQVLSNEAAWRLQLILDRLGEHDYHHPDARRTVRAVAALQTMATPKARQVLTTWSRGAEGALLTEQAAEALMRLGPPDDR